MQQASPLGVLVILALFAVRAGVRYAVVQGGPALPASVESVTGWLLALAVGLMVLQKLEIWLRAAADGAGEGEGGLDASPRLEPLEVQLQRREHVLGGREQPLGRQPPLRKATAASALSARRCMAPTSRPMAENIFSSSRLPGRSASSTREPSGASLRVSQPSSHFSVGSGQRIAWARISV